MVTTDPSTHERWPTPDNTDLLPAAYDRLVPIEQVTHGRHNPRDVQPSDALRQSVANQGLQHPLVVHQPDGTGLYHVTDGWQRYQAAADAGWDQLPVSVHDTVIEALQHSECESLGRAYSTYHWAQLCQSVATELDEEALRDGHSMHRVAQRVAARVDNARSTQTVKRYLRVLSLPEEIHPLLIDGPEGSQSDWQALRNHNPEIRRYDGLPWVVAHEIAKHQDELTVSRTLGIAAQAVCFDDQSRAKEFVRRAVESSETPLETIRAQMRINGPSDGRLIVPRTVVSLSSEQKQALIEHTHQTRTPLSEIVEQQIERVAAEVTDDTDG
jgi:ParB/RepB/Spo0J family partition protein